MKYISLLAPFFAKQWPVYLTGVLVLVGVDLLQLAVPRLIGQTVDSFIQNQPFMQHLWQIFGVALAIAALRYVYRECIMGTTRRLEYYLRDLLFSHSLKIPLHVYDKQGPGSIMALTTNDVTAVRMAVGLGMLLFIDAVIMGCATFVVMVKAIHWSLAVGAVLPLLPILAAATVMGRTVHTRFRAVQDKYSELTEFTQETFAGVKVIKSFHMEQNWLDRFADVSAGNVAANLSMAKLQAAYVPVTHMLPLLSYALTLYIGGRLVMEGALSVGDLAAFIGYLGLLLWPVMGVGYLINTLQRGFASLERVGDFLTMPAYDTDESGQVNQRIDLRAPITIQNLTFRYPGGEYDVLDGLTLRIPFGARIGIVGRPGAGKTTLLKLLLRLYDPPVNTIWLGQREIHELTFGELRSGIGYVPQEAALFSKTIGENIAFGRGFYREQVMAAAKMAAVDEDIDRKPEGYGSLLGERGKRLSGGQQQRVAVARALIGNPEILLLDDVFSALDYQTQARLLVQINHYLAGRTALVVSQRVAAVKDADMIYVMDEGRIVEQGTHEELVKANGLYRRLYEQQFVNGDE